MPEEKKLSLLQEQKKLRPNIEDVIPYYHDGEVGRDDPAEP